MDVLELDAYELERPLHELAHWVRLARREHKVLGRGLLEHTPHALDVVARCDPRQSAKSTRNTREQGRAGPRDVPCPQSRFASRLPRYKHDCFPSEMSAAARVILRVTNVLPRRGLSWLKRMPLHANMPYDSR